MTRKLRAARRLAAVSLAASLMLGLLPAPAVQAATVSEIRNGLERKINNARADRGLRRLKVEIITQTGAQGHAEWMSNHGLIHDSSTELWTEVPAGAVWRAENIGWATKGLGVVKRLHRAFMNSPGHKANILARRATHIGIGVVKADGKVWVVERFVDLKP